MPLSINTNIASMTAQRAMLNSNSALETSFERLSTGKRINSSVDDAAGLAIGKELESRVSGLNQAIRNTNDGISIIQIAEGALDEGTTILQRIRDLAVQASSDSLSSDERGYLKTEADALIDSFEDVTAAAKWNGSSVFTATAFVFQTGADADDEVSVTIGVAGPGTFLDAEAVAAGTADSLANAKLDVTFRATTTAGGDRTDLGAQANAQLAITNIDNALKDIASTRATLGATQSQLESTVRNLANVAENTAAAAGRIMDTDYAAETANLTKAQILQQAATSILAQANAQPQSVLALLQ
jgi:flagellin